jgi:hypothetical protein
MLPPTMYSYLSVLLALPAVTLAVTLDCEKIRIDKQDFNLAAIGGPKTVHLQEYDPPSIANTTFTIDICDKLQRDEKVDKAKQCPFGTQVCGVEEIIRSKSNLSLESSLQRMVGLWIPSGLV